MATVAPSNVSRTPDHRYFAGARELLGVTRTLELGGVSDFTAPWFTEGVRDRGQAVHAMVAADVDGTLDEGALEPSLVGYLTGWRLFCAEVEPVVDFSEQIVSDLQLGCAGTLDLLVHRPGQSAARRTLLDIKPAIYPSAAVQTAAYARMAAGLYDTPMLLDRAALVLPGDGTYRLHPFTDRSDDRVFLAALTLASWKVRHGLVA